MIARQITDEDIRRVAKHSAEAIMRIFIDRVGSPPAEIMEKVPDFRKLFWEGTQESIELVIVEGLKKLKQD